LQKLQDGLNVSNGILLSES